MNTRNKTAHFSFGNFILSSICSFLLIGASWTLCIGLQKAGCPFPKIDTGRFYDLGFFALSNFSFITFLAMIPFQMAEGKLSPGFYSKIVNRAWSHFGLYVLMSCFITCYAALTFHRGYLSEERIGQLFVAIALSVVFALIFHRHQTLRYIYQPAIVFEHFDQLTKEESRGELWLDLYECTLKAIKENRVSDARKFIDLLAQVYTRMNDKEKMVTLPKDLYSLYQTAKEQHPIYSHIEKNWPFLRFEASPPLSEALAGIMR